jgi:CRISPR/Cas system CSM-associated protein Csm3 (group 7 of RAMP superfamily)
MRAFRVAIARVTIEATSPIIVASGRGDAESDAVCVTDANGIPMIPGTSIAGMLRHQGGKSANVEGNPFGFQQSDRGARSRIIVHHAYAHDSSDRPVSALPRAESRDLVLQAMCDGTIRDHVRLNGNGTADETGKFDERLVPRGARFTFDVVLEAASSDVSMTTLQDELRSLLAPLAQQGAALGGRTRRGFGMVKVSRASIAAIDLTQPDGRKSWANFVRGEAFGGAPLQLDKKEDNGRIRGVLKLEPEDFWLFGRGEDVVDDIPSRDGQSTRQRRTQLVPFREPVITWTQNKGQVTLRPLQGERDSRPAVIAASGIKGALRHRALFHARRLMGEWNDNSARPEQTNPSRDPHSKSIAELSIELLFGFEAHRERRGVPGRVFIGDVAFVPSQQGSGRLDHVTRVSPS